MELVWAGLVIGVAHIALLHVLINIMRLPYSQFLVAQFVATLVIGAIGNAVAPAWKSRVGAALNKEERAGRIGEDILGMFAIVIIAALISAGMIYRAYGIGGMLGSAGAALLANALV